MPFPPSISRYQRSDDFESHAVNFHPKAKILFNEEKNTDIAADPINIKVEPQIEYFAEENNHNHDHLDNSENEEEADDGEPAEIDLDNLKCLLCMKKFPNLVKLAFHMNSQHYNSVEDKGFKCPKCELFYESEAELREHIKDEHPKTCSICQQTVKNMSAHMRNEHSNFSKTPFHCIDCDFKSHTQKNLSKHMKEKHSQQPKVETVR